MKDGELFDFKGMCLHLLTAYSDVKPALRAYVY